MKTTGYLLSLLFLLSFRAPAQTGAPDSLQTDRLVHLCQLWGHAHFFHPYLAYQDLPWDSAFAAAVPRVLAAADSAGYARALEDMLAVLGDPLTRVMPGENTEKGPFSTGEKHPLFHFTADSVLVVELHNYRDLGDWEGVMSKFRQIAAAVPKSRGVLFDLRVEVPDDDNLWVLDYAVESSGLKSRLSDAPLQTPGQRARMHDGFAPENGSTSGGYFSAFYTQDGQRIAPATGAKAIPVVFLIDEKSPLPPVALALQAAGKGGIVAAGKVTDSGLAHAVPMDMGEGISVQLRTAEVLQANGAVGVPINRTLPAGAGSDEAHKAALQFLSAGDFSMPPAGAPPAMVAAPVQRKYPPIAYPDLGYRVLAGAKIWSVVHYFFAYKELMERDWDGVLREYLPRLTGAADSLAYHLAVAEMYTHIQDGHGFINSRTLTSHFGQAPAPVIVRMIENQPVITAIAEDSVAQALGLETGDVITHVGGVPAQEELARHERSISASNANWRRYQAAQRLLRGADGSSVEVRLTGKNKQAKTVSMPRKQAWWAPYRERANERHQTGVIRVLDGNIGYADLERLSPEEVDTMFEQLKNTKAIIFDMRGYPRGTAWAIAPRLTDKKKVAGAFFQRYTVLAPDITYGDVLTGFTKNYFYQPLPASEQWKYRGKTVMLIDERTISQAEHSGLFYEAANGTVFIGSQTAGANGDVTSFEVPGGIRLNFSGHDVRHANGQQLQKTGLVPIVEVRPTIGGIRAGKDEVLERALVFLKKGQ